MEPTITETTAKAYSPRCPSCGATINAQAIVSAFGEPQEWTAFYGEPGQRWRCCTGKRGRYAFTHFYTMAGRKRIDRLAWTG